VSISAGDVMTISALVVVISYASDLISKLLRRRKQLTADERAAEREPEELHGLVLGNVREMLAVNRSVVDAMRADLLAARADNDMKDTQIAELRRLLQAEQHGRRQDSIETGRLYTENERLRQRQREGG